MTYPSSSSARASRIRRSRSSIATRKRIDLTPVGRTRRTWYPRPAGRAPPGRSPPEAAGGGGARRTAAGRRPGPLAALQGDPAGAGASGRRGCGGGVAGLLAAPLPRRSPARVVAGGDDLLGFSQCRDDRRELADPDHGQLAPGRVHLPVPVAPPDRELEVPEAVEFGEADAQLFAPGTRERGEAAVEVLDRPGRVGMTRAHVHGRWTSGGCPFRTASASRWRRKHLNPSTQSGQRSTASS
jgi:hypothetical protein